MKYFYVTTMIFFLNLISGPAYPFSDQATTERILKDNRSFIDFINVSVTNFSSERKDDLKKIYEKHFNAEVAYLQFDYRRAYNRIYESQREMVKLYETMLRDHYLEASKKILDTIAPDIIRSKNARARLYLTLGYRDRTVSWTHYVGGDASNPKKYSYKLFKYEEAIKMARRAKRYAFLALFECQTVKTKYSIYNYMLKKEKEINTVFFNRFLDLSENDMIKEMNKSYEEFLKDDNKRKLDSKSPDTEKNVDKRVRFRHENRAARYLLNREFDKAEDIMRKYVNDFNFKLTGATFDILGKEADGIDNKDGQPEEKIDNDPAPAGINVEEYKIHLMDNYLKMKNSSILRSVMRDVKIDDDIGKFKIEGEDIPPIISKEEYEKLKKEESGETIEEQPADENIKEKTDESKNDSLPQDNEKK